jgi:hypothetical protein
MLGKHSITELYSSPLSVSLYLKYSEYISMYGLYGRDNMLDYTF